MRRELTRRALLAGTGAAALSAATGCATGGITNREAVRLAPGATRPVTGRITVWSWDSAAVALTRLAKKFRARHPGTEIHVVDIGYENAADKTTVGLRADTGLADVVTVEGLGSADDQHPLQQNRVCAQRGQVRIAGLDAAQQVGR